MNFSEWHNSPKYDGKYKWYNKTKSILLSRKFECDGEADRNSTDIHHLRDTEEQRKYNDEHYELWGFNEDGTFEYGKYVVFWTHEHHTYYHSKISEESRQKRSEIAKSLWENDEYRNKVVGKRSGELHWCYGKHRDEETREKISKSLSGENHPNYGKHLSDETKGRISEKNKGKAFRLGAKNSPEHNKKISDANKGRFVGEKSPNYGKPSYNKGNHHSEEAKEKIRLGNLGKIVSDETKEKQRASCSKRSALYKEYKNSGGTIMWREFNKLLKQGYTLEQIKDIGADND